MKAGATINDVLGQTVGGRNSPILGGEMVPGLIAVGTTLSLQAALAFEKYRFGNGLMLGITLAAANWYADTARRKDLPQSPLVLTLIAACAVALTLALQQAARVFAS